MKVESAIFLFITSRKGSNSSLKRCLKYVLDHNTEDSAITSLYIVDCKYYLQCNLTQISSCSKSLKLTASKLRIKVLINAMDKQVIYTAQTNKRD